jgi:hypothetical protein
MSRATLNAPHGWIRAASYGGKWHRATCSGTPACGSSCGRRGETEKAEIPPLSHHHGAASVCVACFRAAVGIDKLCTCGCTCSCAKTSTAEREDRT